MTPGRRADKSGPERRIGPSAAGRRPRRRSGCCGRTGSRAAGGGRLRLHAAEPGALSVAVVLGLLLRGDRLAALRAGAGAGRAGEPARGPAAPTASSATRSSGTGRSRWSARSSTTSPRAAPCRPRRSSRRCSPGPGGSPSATRPRSRGSAPTWTGSPPTATSRATGCSGSCSRTSPGSTPRRSSNRSGAGARTGASASRCWSGATASSGSTRGGSAPRGGPLLCETLVNTMWSLSLQALGRPSATPALVERLWDERRGLFLDEAQPGGARPASSPGPRWRRWRCPTCRRRSAAAWSRSTC